MVHLCYNGAGEKLAVKILPKVRAKQAPERTLRKLQKEVALMGRVARETAGVTRLVEVFQDAQYVYIVMGLNEGGDLEGILEVGDNPPLPWLLLIPRMSGQGPCYYCVRVGTSTSWLIRQ